MQNCFNLFMCFVGASTSKMSTNTLTLRGNSSDIATEAANVLVFCLTFGKRPSGIGSIDEMYSSNVINGCAGLTAIECLRSNDYNLMCSINTHSKILTFISSSLTAFPLANRCIIDLFFFTSSSLKCSRLFLVIRFRFWTS